MNNRLVEVAPELADLVSDLLDYAESATLEGDKEPEIFSQARRLLAWIEKGENK